MTQRSTNRILCGLVLQFKTFKYDNVDRKVSSIWRSFYYDRASSDTENQTKLYQRISELLPPVSIQLHENKNIRWREGPTLTTLREAHEFKYSLKHLAFMFSRPPPRNKVRLVPYWILLSFQYFLFVSYRVSTNRLEFCIICKIGLGI